MPDFSIAIIKALQSGSAFSFPLVLGAGVLSSAGPCAAPRILALSSLILRSSRPLQTTLAFLFGTLSIYALIGFCAGGVIARLSAASSLVYLGVALAAISAGIATLYAARWHSCAGESADSKRNASVGVAFAAGAGFSLMVSPCCTPVIGLVLAVSSLNASPLALAALAVTFGIGHAAVLLVACLAGRSLLERIPRLRVAQGAQVVAGTLMLALGAYYALLV